jgi:hypothetical protein
MNPLGESLVYQDKRPSKCATPYCKIPDFFVYCCKLILNWLRKRERVDVLVAVFFIVPTTLVNPDVALTRFAPTTNGVLVSAVTVAGNVLHRCPHAFLDAVYILDWRWY